METDSKPLPRAPSLPLDPPPFYLEREIRVPAKSSWVKPTLFGFIVLLVLLLTIPNPHTQLRSLELLTAISLCTAVVFILIRSASYWLVWLWIKTRFLPHGGIHPAARGELPRNAFLTARLAPCFIMFFGCLAAGWKMAVFRTELVLAAAVLAALSHRDLMTALRVISSDRSHWIKVTKDGLDVLKPAVDFRHSRS